MKIKVIIHFFQAKLKEARGVWPQDTKFYLFYRDWNLE